MFDDGRNRSDRSSRHHLRRDADVGVRESVPDLALSHLSAPCAGSQRDPERLVSPWLHARPSTSEGIESNVPRRRSPERAFRLES